MKVLYLLLFTLPLVVQGEPLTIEKDLAYCEPSESSYQNERCKLDLFLPSSREFATIIWLHGGGLTGGQKDDPHNVAIAQQLGAEGLAVAMVNYRLSPEAKYPAYLEDTAAAVAWTLANISEYGGDPKRVFLAGHSAGGYLTLMVGMDPRWLEARGLKRRDLAGLIPIAGQTMTHYTVRKERLGSDSPFMITADEASPVRYANLKGIPPTHLLWAEHDLPARAEENAYLAALLAGAGHTWITSAEIRDRDHSSVAHNMADANDVGAKSLLQFIERVSSERR